MFSSGAVAVTTSSIWYLARRRKKKKRHAFVTCVWEGQTVVLHFTNEKIPPPQQLKMTPVSKWIWVYFTVSVFSLPPSRSFLYAPDSSQALLLISRWSHCLHCDVSWLGASPDENLRSCSGLAILSLANKGLHHRGRWCMNWSRNFFIALVCSSSSRKRFWCCESHLWPMSDLLLTRLLDTDTRKRFVCMLIGCYTFQQRDKVYHEHRSA